MDDENTPMVIYENDLPEELRLSEEQVTKSLLETGDVPVLVTPTQAELQSASAAVEALLGDYRLIKGASVALNTVTSLEAHDIQALCTSVSALKKTNLYIPSVESYSSTQAATAATTGLFVAIEADVFNRLLETIKRWCRMVYAWVMSLKEKLSNREKKLKEMLKKSTYFKNTVKFKGISHRYLISFKNHKGSASFDIVDDFMKSMKVFQKQLQTLSTIAKGAVFNHSVEYVQMLGKIEKIFDTDGVFNADYYGGTAVIGTTKPYLHTTKDVVDYELDAEQSIDPLQQVELVKFLLTMYETANHDIAEITKMTTHFSKLSVSDLELTSSERFKGLMTIVDSIRSITTVFTNITNGASASIIKLTTTKE